MQKIKFTKPYKFAHGGYQTEEFVAGQEVDASDELAECAISDKVAKRIKAAPEENDAEKAEAEKAEAEKAEAERRAADAAPENAAAKSAPETK